MAVWYGMLEIKAKGTKSKVRHVYAAHFKN